MQWQQSAQNIPPKCGIGNALEWYSAVQCELGLCMCVCVCCRLLQSQVECLSQELADCQKEAEQSRATSAMLEQQLKGGSTVMTVTWCT